MLYQEPLMSDCRHRIGKFSLFIFLLILGGIIISSPVSGDQFVDVPGFVYSYDPASHANSPVSPATPLMPATPLSEGSAPGGSNAPGACVFDHGFGVSDEGSTSIPGDWIIFDPEYLQPMSGAENNFLPGINPDTEQEDPDTPDPVVEPEVSPEILDLIVAIKSKDSDTRVAASKALIAIGPPAIEPLIPYLGTGESDVSSSCRGYAWKDRVGPP